ncbi:EVE domain-containing protein [Vulcanisaeta distributa]|uniref:EVE domain-containing protein n=1 Tax=Vulcanisaeta distributa TaxID=164451 RepID=UPI001494F3C4|nr:EVE domain-containing protein [Vulcanisaeta distributa]
MNYWLAIVRERVFMGIIETGLFGCRDPECGLLMIRIKPGTRLVLFVSGFGCKSYCKSFVGVFEVVGDWVKANRKLNDWSYVVEVKPVVLGRVELGSVAGKLSFTKGRRSITEALHSVDPSNPRAMPMPVEDAELIIKELRSQSTPKPVIEVLGASKGGAREVVGGISSAGAGAGAEAQGVSEVVTLLREAAQLFGYYPVSDVDVGGYRLGLAWWGNEDEYRDGLAPLAVFEVVDNPEQALARLKHARDRWRGVRLYAVVRDEGVRRELERVLRGSFHELRRKVRVIMLDELRGLVQDLKRHGELVREFVMLDKD